MPELCFVASLKKFPNHSPYICTVEGAFLDLEYHYDEGVANASRISEILDLNDSAGSLRREGENCGGPFKTMGTVRTPTKPQQPLQRPDCSRCSAKT